MKLRTLIAAVRSARRWLTWNLAALRAKEIATLVSEIEAAGDGVKLTYLDIGSAGGMPELWRQLIRREQCKAILVDMADEYSKNLPEFGNDVMRVKAALSDTHGKTTVYITRHPACSSCLPPNIELLRKYPVNAWFEVIQEEFVVAERYDEVASRNALPQPHIVKIDVQGFEGRVLRGMGSILDQVLCVEFECQLQPLYIGQDTFFELYALMKEKGFTLRDLKPQGPFEGEAMEFNSFWARTPSNTLEVKIVDFWLLMNAVWPGCSLRDIDAAQRRIYKFNE